jgi:hypothetical protein
MAELTAEREDRDRQLRLRGGAELLGRHQQVAIPAEGAVQPARLALAAHS